MNTAHYDVVVIGSGFGGSVAALRLVEKGYRVAVLEAGARFDEDTGVRPARGDRTPPFPETSWRLRRFLFAPRLGLFGIQRITILPHVSVLSGAGVGGGSLVYANVLYEPGDAFYHHPQWQDITDWRSELAPWYDQAKRMLGATTNPVMTPADEVLAEVAAEHGVRHTFRPTEVGVVFGAATPGEESERSEGGGGEAGAAVPDPFFGGAGPERHACIQCGACMTGCRYNAKNTLTKNYLYLAERHGAEVFELTTVTAVRPLTGGGYAVDCTATGWRAGRRTFTAEQVIFAAGALGTQRLLHRMVDRKVLPELSPRLGKLTRTNSEAILWAVGGRPTTAYSKGVAITSSFWPDEQTHVEPVRYGVGSGALGWLQGSLTDGPSDPGTGSRARRLVGWLRQALRHPIAELSLRFPRGWGGRTVIVLVMQSRDNSLTLRLGRWFFSSSPGEGETNPSWIPVANQVTRDVADRIGGRAASALTEAVNIPTTAHIIGGCVLGESSDTGVVDPYHRIFGYPGLHIVDSSTITANPGVNPALTITAQAERAMSMWPNKGEADPRPEPDMPYRRTPAIAPKRPAVPADAPAALRVRR